MPATSTTYVKQCILGLERPTWEACTPPRYDVELSDNFTWMVGSLAVLGLILVLIVFLATRDAKRHRR